MEECGNRLHRQKKLERLVRQRDESELLIKLGGLIV